jgi:hypothetical protein
MTEQHRLPTTVNKPVPAQPPPPRLPANGQAALPVTRAAGGPRVKTRIASPARGVNEIQPFLAYDGQSDRLATVGRVTAAFVSGTRVCVDGSADYWHLVVEAVTREGEAVRLLVNRRGWLQLSPLNPARELPHGVDRMGRKVSFAYTAALPSFLRKLRLSPGDRRKIVAGVLREYMGPGDWASHRPKRLY